MANAAPTIMGLMSFIQGNNANASARHDANSAKGKRTGALDQMSGFADQIRDFIQKAIAGGTFDAEKGWAKLDAADRQQETLERGSAAARMRNRGFKLGDSILNRTDQAIQNKSRERREVKKQQYEWENLARYEQALGFGSQMYGGLADAYGQDANSARSRMQNPGGFLQSFIPTLNQATGPGGWLH